jgi:tRNA(Ile)-lysidine synthase
LRHEFLARTAARLRIPSVALAQHADDQLELFFLRLLRGSGGDGLAGMKWRGPSPSGRAIELVRPLLDQSKRVLREWAAEAGVRHREDASNAVLEFQRNRIRHELLPLLRRKYQPALDRTIRRVMEIVGAEAEFASQAGREWLRGMGSPKGPRVRFQRLPVAVQRRCVQLQLLRRGIAPDFELVEQLRVNMERPVAVGLARAVLRYAVRDRDGRVHVRRVMAEEFKPGAMQVNLRGRAGEVEFGGVSIGWRILRGRKLGRGKGTPGRECFDADRVGSSVILRHWQAGDRFQPIGMDCSVKLQDFFTNQKVPREERRRLIVATTAQGEVFWVEGMRISERFKLSEGTNCRLQWRWKRL